MLKDPNEERVPVSLNGYEDTKPTLSKGTHFSVILWAEILFTAAEVKWAKVSRQYLVQDIYNFLIKNTILAV